jgi:ATP-dependent helicase/DNAse subunit B
MTRLSKNRLQELAGVISEQNSQLKETHQAKLSSHLIKHVNKLHEIAKIIDIAAHHGEVEELDLNRFEDTLDAITHVFHMFYK